MNIFHRDIEERLTHWAQLPDRKPLLLRGARQVGKTVAVQTFARRFDHLVELNLDLSSDASLFQRGMNARDLYQALLLRKNVPSAQSKILLFMDEIQNCPEAVESLRYFYEDVPGVSVIAAGSFSLLNLPYFLAAKVHDYLDWMIPRAEGHAGPQDLNQSGTGSTG